jgi:hypothetical protein
MLAKPVSVRSVDRLGSELDTVVLVWLTRSGTIR